MHGGARAATRVQWPSVRPGLTRTDVALKPFGPALALLLDHGLVARVVTLFVRMQRAVFDAEAVLVERGGSLGSSAAAPARAEGIAPSSRKTDGRRRSRRRSALGGGQRGRRKAGRFTRSPHCALAISARAASTCAELRHRAHPPAAAAAAAAAAARNLNEGGDHHQSQLFCQFAPGGGRACLARPARARVLKPKPGPAPGH